MNNRELYTLVEALEIIDKGGFFGEKPTIEKIRSVVNKIKKNENEKKEKALSDYKKLEGNIYLLKEKTSSLSMELGNYSDKQLAEMAVERTDLLFEALSKP